MNTLFSNFKQLALVAATAFLSVHAVADTKEQIMFSKYLKYGFCMEKSFGQPWTEKSKLRTVMSRWGAQEPTLRAITAASPEVKAKDKQCRLETGIQDEPRPK
jgi:hypothetical protein